MSCNQYIHASALSIPRKKEQSQATATIGVPRSPSRSPSITSLLLLSLVPVPVVLALSRLSRLEAIPNFAPVFVPPTPPPLLAPATEPLWAWLIIPFPGADGWVCWEKSFHLRQPSKSISACIQPHSMTLRSSQTKFTGYLLMSQIQGG